MIKSEKLLLAFYNYLMDEHDGVISEERIYMFLEDYDDDYGIEENEDTIKEAKLKKSLELVDYYLKNTPREEINKKIDEINKMYFVDGDELKKYVVVLGMGGYGYLTKFNQEKLFPGLKIIDSFDKATDAIYLAEKLNIRNQSQK